MKALQRIGGDLKRRRHIDAYVVTAAALVLAVMSLADGIVGGSVRWAVVLAALSLLVYQITLPEPSAQVDDVLRDRRAFDDTTFASRIKDARELWVFAPSAVNLLGGSTAEDLRRTVLDRSDGLVRIAVLDPAATSAIEIAARQLDDGLDFPVQKLDQALATTHARLDTMATWRTPGTLEYRHVSYNPGFSLVVIDPHRKGGILLLEIHGFRNTSTGNRMHIELHRDVSAYWFDYWTEQFEILWRSATPAKD